VPYQSWNPDAKYTREWCICVIMTIIAIAMRLIARGVYFIETRELLRVFPPTTTITYIIDLV